MRRLLLTCLLALMPAFAAASPFAEGRAHYAAGDYEAAAASFRAAVEEADDIAAHHHWLGKAYGRKAERAGWFRAVRLAGKTRDSFRRAVELDPDDIEALEDLADFYDSAPGFLGGDRDQAEQLRERIAELRAAAPAQEPPL